jgi:hypothetical protein
LAQPRDASKGHPACAQIATRACALDKVTGPEAWGRQNMFKVTTRLARGLATQAKLPIGGRWRRGAPRKKQCTFMVGRGAQPERPHDPRHTTHDTTRHNTRHTTHEPNKNKLGFCRARLCRTRLRLASCVLHAASLCMPTASSHGMAHSLHAMHDRRGKRKGTPDQSTPVIAAHSSE